MTKITIIFAVWLILITQCIAFAVGVVDSQVSWDGCHLVTRGVLLPGYLAGCEAAAHYYNIIINRGDL